MEVTEGAKANSGLWLILVAAFAAFALCVLIGILGIYYHKKQQTLSQLLCGTSGCVTTLRKYSNLSLAYETEKSSSGIACRVHVARELTDTLINHIQKKGSQENQKL